MKKIISILTALGAFITFGIAGANPALAETGPWRVCTEFGNGYCIGADSTGAGNPILNRVGGRSLNWSQQGIDNNGYVYGYFVFNDSGNYMAATTPNCGGITIKSSLTSNGTIWVQYTGEAGHIKFANRYCSGGANHYGSWLASDNAYGHQWYIGFDLPGDYEKVTVTHF